jgi:hypothetical protein
VLAGLELGSEFTWHLAHKDLVTPAPTYGPDATTPYPFIFIGLKDYGLAKRIITEPGTDGTVRWAGAGFNCRRITVDLTREADERASRVEFGRWSNELVPLVLLDNHNHGSIFGEPTADLFESVREALNVDNADDYAAWRTRHEAVSRTSIAATGAHRWQQFVTRLVDERGDGISDYYVELYTRDAQGAFREIENFNLDFHAYREDPSYRCFHVDLDDTGVERLPNLWLRLIASSGSKLVGYHGFGSERMTADGVARTDEGKWDAVIDLSSNLASAALPDGRPATAFFTPFTTTLIEMKMNREPMPLDARSPNQIAWFLERLP